MSPCITRRLEQVETTARGAEVAVATMETEERWAAEMDDDTIAAAEGCMVDTPESPTDHQRNGRLRSTSKCFLYTKGTS